MIARLSIWLFGAAALTAGALIVVPFIVNAFGGASGALK